MSYDGFIHFELPGSVFLLKSSLPRSAIDFNEKKKEKHKIIFLTSMKLGTMEIVFLKKQS